METEICFVEKGGTYLENEASAGGGTSSIRPPEEAAGGNARLHSCALLGGEAVEIGVEVDIGRGLPYFVVVGLPDRAVRESLERVRAAIGRSGFGWPTRRVTINLAPASIEKAGAAFDLPIALGLLAAWGEIHGDPGGWLVSGEVGLNGKLRPAPGGYAMGILARARGLRLLAPPETAREAADVAGCDVHTAESIREAARIFSGEVRTPARGRGLRAGHRAEVDLAEVRGQSRARRVLEIAAAGGHNLLFVGPPGAGKTMLARALPGILPEPVREEVEEIARIASARGEEVPVEVVRPFRAPHPNASLEAVVGGGPGVRPGEITRAHRGVLLLDEIAEFRCDLLEALRGPLESGEVLVARASRSVRMPARFLLVATMNPCRCGLWGDGGARCRCAPNDVAKYQGRLSGPLRDRIDLALFVDRPATEDLLGPPGEASAAVRARVEEARRFLASTRAGPPGFGAGAALVAGAAGAPLPEIDATGRRLLLRSAEEYRFSARATARVLGVARTIAALAGQGRVGDGEVAEAVSYRLLDLAHSRRGNVA